MATKNPAKKKSAVIRREDHAGHLDPGYAADLLAKGEETRTHDDDRGFLPEGRARDSLAAELGEEAVVAMTSGEDDLADDLDAPVSEEQGGPFVPSSSHEELAHGTDPSNPKGATREPFPKT
jgi:hypothetical protein